MTHYAMMIFFITAEESEVLQKHLRGRNLCCADNAICPRLTLKHRLRSSISTFFSKRGYYIIKKLLMYVKSSIWLDICWYDKFYSSEPEGTCPSPKKHVTPNAPSEGRHGKLDYYHFIWWRSVWRLLQKLIMYPLPEKSWLCHWYIRFGIIIDVAGPYWILSVQRGSTWLEH